MCLDTVKVKYDKPSDLIVDGWKDFGGSDKKPEVQFSVKGSRVIPLDTWVQASGEHTALGVLGTGANSYKSGFHANYDEIEVKSMSTMRRVYLRKISCMGTQSGKRVVVAQEMYVPSEKNGWPPKEVQGKKKSSAP